MSDPSGDDDLAEKARDIFERLKATAEEQVDDEQSAERAAVEPAEPAAPEAPSAPVGADEARDAEALEPDAEGMEPEPTAPGTGAWERTGSVMEDTPEAPAAPERRGLPGVEDLADIVPEPAPALQTAPEAPDDEATDAVLESTPRPSPPVPSEPLNRQVATEDAAPPATDSTAGVTAEVPPAPDPQPSAPQPEPSADASSTVDASTSVSPAATGPEEASAPAETTGSVAAAPDATAAPLESPVTPESPFAAPLPRIVAIANQKGGVGKTTTAVNLSACLAELGYRVLVVDLDPQGNATTGLGINPRNLQVSMYDVLLADRPLEDCIEPTSVKGLFVAPSSLDLAGAEIELVPVFSRELKLRRAIAEVSEDFDFVVIDCPPSLGLLTVNGLAAATEVLVPIQCEYYALEGLGQLLRNVNMVQRNLNPDLVLRAIVLVMYDARTKLSGEVVQEVRTHFGDKVCRNVVPRTVRLSEAPSFGQPIVAFDPSSRGAIAYRELAKEFSGGAPQMASPAG